MDVSMNYLLDGMNPLPAIFDYVKTIHILL